MSLHLNISDEAEHALRSAWGASLDRAALEALAIEGYRSGKFGIGVVTRLLGVGSRIEAEQWLAAKGVYLNYSIHDLEADRQALEGLLGKTA